MINPFAEIDWRPDDGKVRRFGLTVLIGLGAVALLLAGASLAFGKGGLALPACISGAALAVAALSWASPSLARPIYLAWFAASASIGIVVSNLLLTVFFYALFTPYALASRLLAGRDPLRLKLGEAKSLWSDAAPPPDVKSYFKQY